MQIRSEENNYWLKVFINDTIHLCLNKNKDLFLTQLNPKKAAL